MSAQGAAPGELASKLRGDAARNGNASNLSQLTDDAYRRAVNAFLAGLPRHRGRVVTSSSEPDSWKRKHPAIARRLAFERSWKTHA